MSLRPDTLVGVRTRRHDFDDRFLQLFADLPGIAGLTVHLHGLGRIDTSGALVLHDLLQQAREAGLAVELVDVRPRWRGLVEHIIAEEADPLGR